MKYTEEELKDLDYLKNEKDENYLGFVKQYIQNLKLDEMDLYEDFDFDCMFYIITTKGKEYKYFLTTEIKLLQDDLDEEIVQNIYKECEIDENYRYDLDKLSIKELEQLWYSSINESDDCDLDMCDLDDRYIKIDDYTTYISSNRLEDLVDCYTIYKVYKNKINEEYIKIL